MNIPDKGKLDEWYKDTDNACLTADAPAAAVAAADEEEEWEDPT